MLPHGTVAAVGPTDGAGPGDSLCRWWWGFAPHEAVSIVDGVSERHVVHSVWREHRGLKRRVVPVRRPPGNNR